MINVKRLIYILKQRYPGAIDIYRQGRPVLDVYTGKTTIPTTKYKIDKAVVLPLNSQFTNPLLTSVAKLSGTMISGVRLILLDANDIPIEPTERDYIAYRGDRYDIAKVEQLDNNKVVLGYMLTVQEATSEQAYFIHDPIINDKLNFAQTFIKS